ncbi:hypothetical protein [Flagellimonas algicola]|uniref:HMA domain-containing protein n=1 Tax=Flagellimonas algicola TaxID=2583815 RepID=A0ABY2WM81_9FLAO|nr:hypothetical protein [Allomuricauda algicola]TMU55636.1 hypothetical protein FGG15_15840 [Allomuricauda algicola]
MRKGLAKIPVAQAFCDDCASGIKKQLLGIEGIYNVCTNPMDSLVWFHFGSANELALALNKLMEIGHPPLGDKIKKENYVPPLCQCTKVGSSAA